MRGFLAGRRVAGSPAFEPFPAVLQQRIIIWKVKFETVFGGSVVLAVVIAVRTAYGGSVVVYVATPVAEQMLTTGLEHHEPAVIVPVNAHAVMRYLP